MRASIFRPPTRRVATPRELHELGLDGVLDRGMLPPIAGGSPLIPQDPGGQPAIQTLSFTGGPTGGSVTITHPAAGGQTATLNQGATVPQAQQAIQSLPGLGSVQVAGSAGGPYTVTFPVSQTANGNQLITRVTNNLTGGASPDLAVTLTQTGILGGDEMSGTGAPAPEVPRIVGASGQPAYATGWSAPGASTALTVPVATARGDWEPAQFYVDREGFIHIEGVAVWGAAAAPLIFTLPTGPGVQFDYAPGQTQVGANDVEVRPDGTVQYMGSTASAGALQLNAEYRAKGV